MDRLTGSLAHYDEALNVSGLSPFYREHVRRRVLLVSVWSESEQIKLTQTGIFYKGKHQVKEGERVGF